MNIKNVKIADITPYNKNAKKHDKTQIANVAESIKQYGFVQPVVIDSKGVIVIGHCRVLAAKKLGMTEVPCVCVDDLTPEQVNALRIVDNKANESAWDMDVLKDALTEADMTRFDFDFNFGKDESGTDNPYTTFVKIPQYQIQGACPRFEEMYDGFKEKTLIDEIERSSVTDEEKEFLISAAHRHCRFNFTAIAEYYAHATAEMQRLMEESALVIIDVNDAIANGYVRLSKGIEALRDVE